MRMKLQAAIILLVLALMGFLPAAMAAETSGLPGEELKSFTDAFVTVPTNPLPGDLPWLLWLIAQDPLLSPAVDAPLSPLAEAAAKFAALISTEGVYYTETSKIMGMTIKAEYWMKGDMFKKADSTLNEVSLYDGQWFYKYSAGKKTGTRLAPDDPQAAAEISMIKNYTLSAMALQPYQQQDDKKLKPYDCQVFYMDMEFMGMKGNWLYIDKATGALIKNQYGPEKGGMSVVLSKLKVGGFGDEAFSVPAKVKITGP